MRVHFKIFRSAFTSWESLFEEAAAFCNRIGPDRVISISHSHDNVGVVTVSYRVSDEELQTVQEGARQA
jgi:hypothetical protein